jgi:hypothetical protein
MYVHNHLDNITCPNFHTLGTKKHVVPARRIQSLVDQQNFYITYHAREYTAIKKFTLQADNLQLYCM